MNVTEFENVSTQNWTMNATLGYQNDFVHKMSFVSVITHAMVAVLTVLFNCCMLACLQKTRPNISEVIYKQLFSLCISDILAGISSAVFCLTLIDSVNRSSMACIFVMTTFPGAQNAVLINLCVLSFRRWLILRKASELTVRFEPSLLWILFYTLCPWIVSLLFAHVSTFTGITENSRINGCLSPDLIKNPTGLFAVAALQIITLIFINFFYIYTVIRLKRLARQGPTTNLLRHSVQKRAFFHLIAVLMVTNVTTVPSILLTFFVDPRTSGTTFMDFVPHFQTINSLINPILYCAHINEIRATIKDMCCSSCQMRKIEATTLSSYSESNNSLKNTQAIIKY